MIQYPNLFLHLKKLKSYLNPTPDPTASSFKSERLMYKSPDSIMQILVKSEEHATPVIPNSGNPKLPKINR